MSASRQRTRTRDGVGTLASVLSVQILVYIYNEKAAPLPDLTES